jgi:hypothetical protein
MNTLKQVESTSINSELTITPFKTISGDDISFTLANKTGSTFSHLFSTLRLPVNQIMNNKWEQTFINGGFSGTAIQDLYNINSVIFFNIDASAYEQMIDGRTFSLNIPLDNTYSGVTSGLSTTTLYSSYVKTNSLSQPSPTNPNLSTFDTNYSEKYLPASEYFGNPDNQIQNYESGVVWLFSNDIQRPNNFSGNSWSTASNNNNPYTNGKQSFNFISTGLNNVDKAVGILNLNAGLGAIFNFDLVNSFDFSVATGGTGTTLATFSLSDASINLKSVNIDFSQRIIAIAGADEFFTSQNPTYHSDCNGMVKITKIGLYNDLGECIAIVVPNEPITKQKDQFITFDIKLGF